MHGEVIARSGGCNAMAINLTVVQLLSALRMGASTEETAEAKRLLGYATASDFRNYLGTAYEGTASEQIVERG